MNRSESFSSRGAMSGAVSLVMDCSFGLNSSMVKDG
jgi:hypothetical protein